MYISFTAIARFFEGKPENIPLVYQHLVIQRKVNSQVFEVANVRDILIAQRLP